MKSPHDLVGDAIHEHGPEPIGRATGISLLALTIPTAILAGLFLTGLPRLGIVALCTWFALVGLLFTLHPSAMVGYVGGLR